MKKGYFCLVLMAMVSLSVLAMAGNTAAETYVMDPTTGLYPDEYCQPFELSETGTSGSVDITEGGLVQIETTTASDTFYYKISGSDISIDNGLIIEAEVEVLSGSDNYSHRGVAGIGFTAVYEKRNVLYIEEDEAFLLSAPATRGDSVSIGSGSHEYRIVVDSNEVVSVFIDDEATASLTGTLLSGYTGQNVKISWGDLTDGEYGVSEWEYFKHNACIPLTVQ